MTFDILQHLDQLEPDGGTNNPRGDHSYKCPACGASNFKVHVVSGKWGAYGCECSSTEAGKRAIREALSPARPPGQDRPLNLQVKSTAPQGFALQVGWPFLPAGPEHFFAEIDCATMDLPGRYWWQVAA